MSTAAPAIVRAHFTHPDGSPGVMTAYLHDSQDDGYLALVHNPAAYRDRSACCWRMPLDQVTRVEVLDPGIPEPTVMEQLLAATAITPRQRLVYDAIVDAGGRLQFTDIADVLDEAGHALARPQITDALQALVTAGRITVTHSAALHPGIVTVN